MAAAKRKIDWAVQPAAVIPAERGPVHAPSPARALQQLLDERTAQADDVRRWSRRRQVAFIATASAALWIALLEIATQAVRAIA